MELEVKLEDLQKKSIFVATPMYGGQCFGSYTKSVQDLTIVCMNKKIGMKNFFLFNESLITRARNYLVDEFLRSNFTHLLFIDSDISFDANDVLTLLALDKDIVGGPYPKKTLAYEKMVTAVQKGAVTEKNPEDLKKYIGDIVFNPLHGETQININKPIQVSELGTGFMMIERSVFAKYAEAYPELEYTPDHNRSEHFNGERKIHAYFDTVIDPLSDRYLSEDYMFCRWAQKIGIEIWLCPWMKLNHSGTFIYSSDLAAQARLEAMDFLKEHKK